MSMVVKVASLLKKVLGAETEELAQAHGLIQRKRKFTGQSLLRMLVGTLLKKSDAKYADWVLTAAQMGVRVSATAVEKRFAQRLVVLFKRGIERSARSNACGGCGLDEIAGSTHGTV